MHFIVKFFPEITIKSPPVRKRFIRQLRENLRELLSSLPFKVEVKREWDKIDVLAEGDDEASIALVSDVLARTPGIIHFSRVQTFPLGDLDDIFQNTMKVWGDALAGKTFCVRAKRQGDHDFTSVEAERYVGGGLNQHTQAAGVKLSNPDITVKLEIKSDTLHVIESQTPGLGGFPLGTQEPVLSLISGGFDSTVSSYLTMKRGIRTHFCFFNLGGREHEIGVKEVAYYLWQKFGASHRVMFVSVPFEGVVEEILTKVENSQMGVVLKRMMLRAASQVAEQMEIPALVTGEAVAQVSSQTLTNLTVIDSVTDTLVLRPLIVMDKGDIIQCARDIGTEEFAAAIPEYCGVISRKPTTRAKEEVVAAEEQNFDMSVLQAAVDNRRMVGIDQVVADLQAQASAQQVAVITEADIAKEQISQTQVVQGAMSEPASELLSKSTSKPIAEGRASDIQTLQVVIDVRHPDEEELKPLLLPDMPDLEVLKIPFYRLSSEFSQLASDVQYLLYCEKGVMSQLHASSLQEAGHHNVAVFRLSS